jgi:uncharacterized protein (TIGR03437 family)
VNAVTGAFVGAPGLLPGVEFVPAKPGDILTLFLTGIGKTDPALEPGELPEGAAASVVAVQVTAGGSPVDSEKVFYAGVTPGNAGLCQLNIQLPDGVPEGDLEIVVKVGEYSSPAGAYVTVSRE